MKSIVLILAVTLCLQMTVFGQITLTQSSYPVSVLGTDSLKVTTAASSFPSLTPLVSGIWDLSAVTDSVPIFYACRVPVAGYQFADSNLYQFGVFNYQGNVQSNIASTGIFEFGEDIQSSKFNIFSITSGANDSFIIDFQTVVYSSPRAKIAFPATYHSSWSSSYSADLHFHLTFLANGDTMRPGIIRTYTTEKDSVTGWGRMRVRDASGSPSVYMHVLQVRTTIVHTDSFFVNGIPFSTTLLTIFNLVQGQKDTVYEQNYYREQEVTPLAQVEFSDAAFTQPYKATTHVQRLQAVSVGKVEQNGGVRVYPNPMSGRDVAVEVPEGDGHWSYELVSATGQKVIGDQLPAVKNIVSIPVPLSAGIYYMRICSNGVQVAVKALEIN